MKRAVNRNKPKKHPALPKKRTGREPEGFFQPAQFAWKKETTENTEIGEGLFSEVGFLRFSTSAVFAGLEKKNTVELASPPVLQEPNIQKPPQEPEFKKFLRDNFIFIISGLAGLICLSIFFGLVLPKLFLRSEINPAFIAGKVETIQLTLNPIAEKADESVKWIGTLNAKDLRQGQKYISLPKDAKNIKLTVFKTQEQAQEYVENQKRKNTQRIITAEDRKEMAGVLEGNILQLVQQQAAALTRVSLAQAKKAVEDVLDEVIPQTAEVQDAQTGQTAETEVITTETQALIDVVNNKISDLELLMSSEFPDETSQNKTKEEKEQKDEEKQGATGAGSSIVAEYETPTPEISEQKTGRGKIIKVSLPEKNAGTSKAEKKVEQKPLVDVVAHATIQEIYKVGQESKIKIKWTNPDCEAVEDPQRAEACRDNGYTEMVFTAFDLNNNGKLDYVEWTVPHLSEQVFEIIFISKAFELDENKEIINDIYDVVVAKDENWANVSNGHYIRATFTEILNSSKDITLYAKPANERYPVNIEVYAKLPSSAEGSDNLEQGQLVATFENIDTEKIYRIFLSELQNQTDVFELKIIGDIQIDWIVDPNTRYWVGDVGGWDDDDNHWATESGGDPSDGNIPGAGDNVVIDSNSCTGACTITTYLMTVSLTDLVISNADAVLYTSTNGINVAGDLTVNGAIDCGLSLCMGTHDACATLSGNDCSGHDCTPQYTCGGTHDVCSTYTASGQIVCATDHACTWQMAAPAYCTNGACSDELSCIGADNSSCNDPACNGNSTLCTTTVCGCGGSWVVNGGSCSQGACGDPTSCADCDTGCCGSWIDTYGCSAGGGGGGCGVCGDQDSCERVAGGCGSTWNASTNCASTWNPAAGDSCYGDPHACQQSECDSSLFGCFNTATSCADGPVHACQQSECDGNAYGCANTTCGAVTLSGASKTIYGTGTISAPITISDNHTIDGTAGIALSGTLAITAGKTVTNNGTATVTNMGSTGAWTQGTDSTLNYFETSITPTLTATATGNTVNYKANADQTIYATTYYNLQAGVGATLTAARTYTLGGNTTVTNALTLGQTSNAYIATLAPSSYTLTLSGTGTPAVINQYSGTNAGAFSTTAGTIKYIGTSANVKATNYYNLNLTDSATDSADSVFTFTAGSTYGVAGALTIAGNNANDRVNLVSSSSGTQWNLNATGTFSINWADVKDSNATGTQPTYTNTIGSGNNTNWGLNTAPALTGISDSPNPVKGGNTITISPTGQADGESDALYFYCNESGTPTAANTLCSASASYSSQYSTMACTYAVETGDTTRTIYCRTYDSEYYSSERTATYVVDTTVAVPSNFSPASGSTIENLTPTITFTLNENGDCYASTNDESYDNMYDDTNCTGDGTTLISCTMTSLGEKGAKNIYISCQDTAGNKDTADTNEDLAYTLDYTTYVGAGVVSKTPVAQEQQAVQPGTGTAGPTSTAADGINAALERINGMSRQIDTIIQKLTDATILETSDSKKIVYEQKLTIAARIKNEIYSLLNLIITILNEEISHISK